MKRSDALAVFLVLAILSSSGTAEERKPSGASPAVETVNLTLHPAPLPRPVLKYHLLPQFLDQTPGNAALLYLKAFVTFGESGPDRQHAVEVLTKPFWDLPSEKPIPFDKLDRVPRGELKKALATFDGAMEILSMASRRESCDWGQPLREQRNVYELLLSEVQMARTFGRFLVVKARLEITEKKYEQALGTLRVGFALAQHVGQQGIIVSDLVGLVIEGMMAETLQSLIASPGAPNLYWTITELPDPLVSYRRGLGLEGASIFLLFPALREVKTARLSPQQWQDLLLQVCVQLNEIGVLMDGKKAPEIDVKSALEKAYPIARRELLARGCSKEQLDAMPPAQVVLVQMVEVFEEARDDLFKWHYLPYWQAAQGIRAWEEQLEKVKQAEGIPVASKFLPSLSQCHLRAAVRQRQIAMLRTMEALRLYAASHGHALPQALDQITEVPIPINPVTGKPFPYKLEGKTAILDADGPPDSHPRQYRLSVAFSVNSRADALGIAGQEIAGAAKGVIGIGHLADGRAGSELLGVQGATMPRATRVATWATTGTGLRGLGATPIHAADLAGFTGTTSRAVMGTTGQAHQDRDRKQCEQRAFHGRCFLSSDGSASLKSHRPDNWQNPENRQICFSRNPL